MGTYKCCLIFKRRYRWTDAPPPEDVRSLFAQHSGGTATMGADGLRRYLESTGTDPDLDGDAEAERLLDQIRQAQRVRVPRVGRPLLGIDDFHRFLFSDDLNPPLRRPQVHHDMAAPLSHYYVYTGHNSYLTGNQLSSDCSDVPIIKALQRGVRVIELDMWPNSAEDDINILHGRTLTTPVSLLKCLRSIKEYAFVASPYPVIITLEDHLPPELQDKVAKMVLEVFGNILYYPQEEHPKELPSPEDLKGRVLLSTKPPKEYLEAKAGGTIKDGDAEANPGKGGTDDDAAWGKEVPDFKTEIQFAKQEDDALDDDDEEEDEQQIQQHLAPQYKHLITIRAGKPKGGTTSDALKCDPNKVRRLSLSEQQLAKAVVNHGTEIVRFTQRNLLRIYPKGTRITSSNYNPFIGWVHGAQMVAFNMQGYGRALWLMHGFYKANGACGYVKKPDFLMQSEPEVFDPKKQQPVKKILKVKVYMGDGWRMDFKQTHFDQYSPPDFYARVGIAGVPADSIMMKTKAIEDNWVPVWGEEFSFKLTVPELALLRVEVHEYDMSEKDDFAGQTVLPVSELQPGIRAVALCDRKGNKYPNVKLLMRFEFESV
ncbi:phosphoinositide phospholipase C 2 isoform X1 [Lolium perenne]|uniref:phosphoinositide phospholipase C 2 isoform X1 n=1 Tax=Lolium perenne TaxID=4522 RepID=UPI0021EA5B79|nr:phosphoinositide phospholipase C 2-like isoform X1 [Lolium perenne]